MTAKAAAGNRPARRTAKAAGRPPEPAPKRSPRSSQRRSPKRSAVRSPKRASPRSATRAASGRDHPAGSTGAVVSAATVADTPPIDTAPAPALAAPQQAADAAPISSRVEAAGADPAHAQTTRAAQPATPWMAYGHPRSVARLEALGLGTLGVGFAWYYFVAFRELDFKAGRRHSALLLLGLLPLVGTLFAMRYVVVELRNLAKDSAAFGLHPPVQPLAHNMMFAMALLPSGVALLVILVSATNPGWLALPLVLGLVAPAATVPIVARDVNAVWDAYARLEASETLGGQPPSAAQAPAA